VLRCDDVSLLQKTDAKTLWSKLCKQFLNHPSKCFSVDKGDHPHFYIEHYAGQVR
jgi:myosin heavy subunit